MKLFLIIISFIFLSDFCAQSPLGIPYQAVMRNADGTMMSNAAVNMIFKIHDGTASGSVVYEESHALTSNAQGLVSCVVGNGVVSQGNFSNIQWGSGAKFLHVLMGTTDLGTQQMLSVPYALYAQNSATPGPMGPQGPPGAGGFTHWIGELYGGGVVFYVYKDVDGYEHGLIVSIHNLDYELSAYPSTAKYPFLPYGITNVQTLSTWDGAANTEAIVSAMESAGQGLWSCAAGICSLYESEGYTDWYLPSIDELALIFQVQFSLNRVMSQIPNGQMFDLELFEQSSGLACYWSSTSNQYGARYLRDAGGNAMNTLYNYSDPLLNGDGCYVRAIRKF